MELIITNKKGEKFTVLYDECDHELINNHRWHINGDKYVQTSIRDDYGKFRMHKIHRVILGVSDKNLCVDHINRNTLDNRRSNLRICTYSQNSMNRKPVGKSKYLGVSFAKKRKSNGKEYFYICANIRVSGKLKYLGSFKTEEDAALAYDEAAKLYNKEFAYLNFP